MSVSFRRIVAGSTVVAVLVLLSAWSAQADIHAVHVGDSIQTAIDATVDGDEVVLDPGTYREYIFFNGHNVTVRSTDPTNPAIVAATIINGDVDNSGAGDWAVVSFENGETSGAVLSGLTITKGNYPGSGGGVRCYHSSPTIVGNIITGNRATTGGGVATSQGTPTIQGNTISNNTTIYTGASFSNGAGMLCYGGSPVISGNAVTGNTGNCGAGGIYCSSAAATIVGNTVSGNTAWNADEWGAKAGGGGIVCSGGSVLISGNTISANSALYTPVGGIGVWANAVISNNIISGNSAEQGAGIMAGGGYTVSVTGNVISNNMGSWMGGGLSAETCTITVSGNTFCGNGGPLGGGGIYCAGANMTVKNSIITDSTVGGGIYLAYGTAPAVTYCNVYNNADGNYANGAAAGAGCISVDPLFANPAGGDYRLKSQAGRWNGSAWVTDAVHSPCIDAGDPAAAYSEETAPSGHRANMGFDGNTATASKSLTAAVIAETGADYGRIQDAMDAAELWQNVVVQPGTWYERIDFKGKGITVRSADPTNPAVVAATILDGSSAGSVVTFSNGEPRGTKLWGLTIQHGSAPSGGGIHHTAGYPAIVGNIVRSCHGGFGGGMYISHCPASVTNNLVTGNDATFGGGIISVDGESTVTNNTIVANVASEGGGGYCAVGTAGVVDNNIIAGNTGGGVLLVVPASLQVAHCDVYGNSSYNYRSIADQTGSNGNISADPLFANPAGGDYRLQSKAGRWNGSAWVTDAVHSPCIDAGDPAAPFADEPAPNGGRVNMGYDGNTMYASKSVTAAIIAETSASYGTVQGAIDAAANGQNVVVQPGEWHERINFKGKAITVRSADPNDPACVAGTVLNGDAGGSVVTFANGETGGAVLQGLTITNGQATGGGGVNCFQTSPTIIGNVITGNHATSGGGGGILCGGGNPTITGNTISNNSVTGGLDPDNAGGGIYCHEGQATISHNVVTGNSASKEGGGIRCLDIGPYVITGNLVTQNSAPLAGGGLSVAWCAMVMAGNTVVSNTCGWGGGGLFMFVVTGTIDSCIFVGNQAPTDRGGGIDCASGTTPPTRYCDLYGNTGGDFLEGSTLIYLAGTNGNISADPLFANAAGGDYRLQSKVGRWNGSAWVTDTVHSPCLDAGDPAAPFTNEPAPNGGRVNMGYDGNTDHASLSFARPLVVSHQPTGTGVSRCASVSLGFSAAMDKTATEAAFSLADAATSTAVTGACSWVSNELQFVPATALAAGTTYRATLTTGARSLEGMPLESDFTWNFTTGSGPAIVLHDPQGSGVPTRTPLIRVGFDRAMNPSVTEAAFSLAKDGTATTIPGTFTWNANELRFLPALGLFPLTDYRVTVAGTAQDATGQTLGADYSWTFRTNSNPTVVWTRPERGATASTRAIVQIAFNQAMKEKITQDAFTLKLSGATDPVAGALSWSYNILVFTPAAPLEMNRTYQATLTTAAQATSGETMPTEYTWIFRTGGPPAVVWVRPEAGKPASTRAIVQMAFNQAMDETVTQGAFSVKPVGSTTAVAGAFAWSYNILVFTPSAPLENNRTYQATLTTAAKSLAGINLPANYAWQFSTGLTSPPRPSVLTAVAAPTGQGAQIAVSLVSPASVSVEITNVAGRVVAVLPSRDLPEGVSNVLWDGRGSTGTVTPAGTYLVHVLALTADGSSVRALAALRK